MRRRRRTRAEMRCSHCENTGDKDAREDGLWDDIEKANE